VQPSADVTFHDRPKSPEAAPPNNSSDDAALRRGLIQACVPSMSNSSKVKVPFTT
jgi:hypothetical protein